MTFLIASPTEEDEDEDDENSEESVEDESEEDLTQTPRTSSMQPPYSLIPTPPVWVQRKQWLSMTVQFQNVFQALNTTHQMLFICHIVQLDTSATIVGKKWHCWMLP